MFADQSRGCRLPAPPSSHGCRLRMAAVFAWLPFFAWLPSSHGCRPRMAAVFAWLPFSHGRRLRMAAVFAWPPSSHGRRFSRGAVFPHLPDCPECPVRPKPDSDQGGTSMLRGNKMYEYGGQSSTQHEVSALYRGGVRRQRSEPADAQAIAPPARSDGLDGAIDTLRTLDLQTL